MDLEIAIPTYNRDLSIKTKTLRLLEKFNKTQIKIYVEDLDQFEEYRKTCIGYDIIITNTTGIIEKRNYIMKNTKAKYLLMLDDDIINIRNINGINITSNELRDLILLGFKTTEDNNARIWGICPYNNNYFFKDIMTTNLKFIIGCFMGIIIKDNRPIMIPDELSVLEDYYLSIKYFIEDGKVIRFNQYGIQQKYFTGVGGLQSLYNKEERIKEQNRCINFIKNNYPKYCCIVKKKDCLDFRLNHRAKP